MNNAPQTFPYGHDFKGHRFGRLVVTGYAPSVQGNRQIVCICDCGNTTTTDLNRAKKGHCKSCGCLAREMMKSRTPKRRPPTQATANMAGKKFGRLVVLAIEECPTSLRWIAVCRCDCGNTTHLMPDVVRRGNTISCGCAQREAAANNINNNRPPKPKVHGHMVRGEETATHCSWRAMRRRCLNPNAKQYKDYGGRGISVCPRWDSFQNFLADMGERPDDTSIDRINPNGNYEPGNCRWADRKTQATNKRSKIGVTTT